jgi:hypothetical protein
MDMLKAFEWTHAIADALVLLMIILAGTGARRRR